MCACMCVCRGITDLHVLHADSLARACDAAVCSECKSVCWVEGASMERVMSSSRRPRLMMMRMMMKTMMMIRRKSRRRKREGIRDEKRQIKAQIRKRDR